MVDTVGVIFTVAMQSTKAQGLNTAWDVWNFHGHSETVPAIEAEVRQSTLKPDVHCIETAVLADLKHHV